MSSIPVLQDRFDRAAEALRATGATVDSGYLAIDMLVDRAKRAAVELWEAQSAHRRTQQQEKQVSIQFGVERSKVRQATSIENSVFNDEQILKEMGFL